MLTYIFHGLVKMGSNNDDKRKLILHELIKNSKISSEDIGKKIGLTRQTVSKIIKKLEDDKTIWGYTIIASETPNYYGTKKHFLAFIKTDDIEELMKNVKRKVLNTNERDNFLAKNQLKNIGFDFAAFYHGEYDLVVAFFADNLFEAKRLISAIKAENPSIKKVDILQPILITRRGGFSNPKLKEEFEKLGID